jgi:hypothetical protein
LWYLDTLRFRVLFLGVIPRARSIGMTKLAMFDELFFPK